jgi:murein DD-endopeptidase MepM/ murein hydrolase activator NlpD
VLQPITRSDVPVSQQFANNPAYYLPLAGTPGHNGVDLAVPIGTQLYAPISGVILEAQWDHTGYGLYVKLGQLDGEQFLLAHLSSLGATVAGDNVIAGTPICLSGNTGNTTGPHVHVGWRPMGSYRATLYDGWCDPEPYLAQLQALNP